MTCDDRSDLVLLRSLGGLAPDEDEAARAAISQECPPLALVQAEADSTLAQIGGALAPVAPSSQARSAFLARLAAAKRPAAAAAAPASTGTSSPVASIPGADAPPPPPAYLTSRPPGTTPGASGAPPRQGPAPRVGILATVLIAGSTALVAVAMVWAPFQQRLTAARAQAETAQQENDSSRLRGDQLASRLATAEADLHRTQAAVEAKAAAVAAQVSELEAVLTTAKAELAKRDARLAAGEAALVESRRDAQHFQDLAKAVSAQVDALTRQHQALATLLSQTEATMAAIRSPQLKVVDLAGGTPQPKAWARLFWDQQHNVWHLLATDLAPLPAGKVYELWFINAASQKIAAGTFTVDAKGMGAVMAVIPPNIGVLTVAAVTDEPVGGVAAPTGSVQLVGTL